MFNILANNIKIYFSRLFKKTFIPKLNIFFNYTKNAKYNVVYNKI